MSSLSSLRLHPLPVRIEGVNATAARVINEFQTLCRIKAPVLKEQTPKLCLERLALRAIGRILEVHHKIVCLWLVQAAEQLPKDISNTEACSVIEVGEIRSFFSDS